MTIPFDLTQVDWFYVTLLAAFALVASYVGNLISFRRRGLAAVVVALLFAAMFVFWTYYPHGLPWLPTSISTSKSGASAAPATAVTPSPPQKPSNPITDITPGNSR
jgi:hypothetical protein